MHREIAKLTLAGAVIALLPGAGSATTREIAELQPARLAFDQSLLNQLTYGTYRDPFDELQTRPYNLLFTNIGRHSTLTPWQGQEGRYTRYFNALIGNNGTANVDNDADSIQGALIRRETAGFAWGVSGSFLSGENGTDDSNGTSTFSDTDNLSGLDVRAGAARQLGERRVLGLGVRATQANTELNDSSFEAGVGGFNGIDEFDQTNYSVDFGMRQFRSTMSSWEIQLLVGAGTYEQDELSETLDDTGVVTDRFVVTSYEISDLRMGLEAGYNRLKSGKLGETSFRIGVERVSRELDNSDLSFSEDAGGITPSVTLLGQDTIELTEAFLSAQSLFQAGETEMFTGARIGFGTVEGATSIDASGVVVNEAIDDSSMHIGLTVGLRQPLFRDKVRFVVSGRADILDIERTTDFDSASDGDDDRISTAQYAIGVEGVLANVTFDLAWLLGEEAPVEPATLGLPQGSRRSVELDRLLFSAAVSW